MQEHREEMQDKAMASLFQLVCDLYKVSALTCSSPAGVMLLSTVGADWLLSVSREESHRCALEPGSNWTGASAQCKH